MTLPIRAKIIPVLLAGMSLLLFFGCSNPTNEVQDTSGRTAYDGNGEVLGEVTEIISGDVILLYTQNGYLVYVFWDGSLVNSEIKAEGRDGEDPFIYSLVSTKFGHFAVAAGDQLYRISDIDEFGVGIPDPSITAYSSVINQDGTITNPPGPPQSLNSTVFYYAVSPATREEIGLPETIVLPITIK